MEGIIGAWGRILSGYTPALSIEITRECPAALPGLLRLRRRSPRRRRHAARGPRLQGPGAHRRRHRAGRRHRPLHLSIVGGEPLVRYRELNTLLPHPHDRGIHVQLVTSAVREIPPEWAPAARAVDRRLDRRPAARTRRAPDARHLRPDPEAHRRAPDRRALHGHPAAGQPARLPRGVPPLLVGPEGDTRKIWISLYTPQIGEVSDERLTPADRARVVADLMALRLRFPKLEAPKGLHRRRTRTRPRRPTNACFRGRPHVSADLTTRITPCQFGGNPDCSNCGCIASAGLPAVARHQLFGFIPVGRHLHELAEGRRAGEAAPAAESIREEQPELKARGRSTGD